MRSCVCVGGRVRKVEAELRGPSLGIAGGVGGGRGGFKGCRDSGSDDFQPATFYCCHFPTATEPSLCMSSVTCQADGVASGQINRRNYTEEEVKE